MTRSSGLRIRLPLILGFRILRSLTCWNDFYNTQKCLYKQNIHFDKNVKTCSSGC